MSILPRILTLGESMGVAITPPGEPLQVASTARLHTAGAETTVAIGLSRLGVKSAWLGVVGSDELGRRICRDLNAEGVETTQIRITPTAPTGFMIRELRTAELARVSYFRAGSAGARLEPADVDRAIDDFAPDLVHITGITAALSDQAAESVQHAVQLARSADITVSLDVNYRASLPGAANSVKIVRNLAASSDIVFIGDDELHVLTDATDPEAAAIDITSQGPAEVIVKRGSLGALGRLGDDQIFTAARPVTVLDVIGAGDGFVAGYLAARAYGLDLANRLRWGTDCAAYVVGTHGDWEGLPTRAELEHFHSASNTVR